MADMDAHADIRLLPQRHAQLLYRFDTEMRLALAPRIAMLSIREAKEVVLEAAEPEKRGGKKRPPHVQAEAKRAAALVRRLLEIPLDAVLGGLDDDDRETFRAGADYCTTLADAADEA
jgi:hypothetical protein